MSCKLTANYKQTLNCDFALFLIGFIDWAFLCVFSNHSSSASSPSPPTPAPRPNTTHLSVSPNTFRNKLSLSVSNLNHWSLSLSKARARAKAKASNGFFTINHSFCFYGDQKRRHFASLQHSQVIHPVVSALSETKAPISC
jgi:hypothetical protein